MAKIKTIKGFKPADLVALCINDWCVKHGAATPQREYRFAAEVGRKWAFDFAWPVAKIAVEIQGGIWVGGRHNRPAGFEADCEKFSTAAVMGWRLLPVTYKHCNNGMLLTWIAKVLPDIMRV